MLSYLEQNQFKSALKIYQGLYDMIDNHPVLLNSRGKYYEGLIHKFKYIFNKYLKLC